MNLEINDTLVERLILITKDNKIDWGHAHHHGESPYTFDEYVSDEARAGNITFSDSFFTKYNNGFFYVIHQSSMNDLQNVDVDEYSRHGIYYLHDDLIIKNDAYKLLAQPSEHLFPDPLFVSNQERLFVLHQVIIRSFSRVEDFIKEFLESTKERKLS